MKSKELTFTYTRKGAYGFESFRFSQYTRGVVCALSATLLCGVSHATSGEVLGDATLMEFHERSDFGFIENKGQIRYYDGSDAVNVRFALQRGDAKIFILNDGIAWQFDRVIGGIERSFCDDSRFKDELPANGDSPCDGYVESFRMDMKLEGANPSSRVSTNGKSNDYINYYAYGITDVYHYREIKFHDVYPGIDWLVYLTDSGIKYDFVVNPGANPERIRMRYTNHEELYLDEHGRLVHGNRMGKFIEGAPETFQQDGVRVKSRFVLEDAVVSFDIDNFDDRQTLTVDPDRVWATYYGGTGLGAVGNDLGRSCAVDAGGNVYLAGGTGSTNAIAHLGHQMTHAGGGDAFLVKFDINGVRQWATYYGGSAPEDAIGRIYCTTDASNNVYLSGTTGSTTGIASGGHQNVHGGGTWDGFLVKFNSSGIRQWGTYYGGSGSDQGFTCSTDGSGNVYLAGRTSSSNGISFAGHQNVYGGNFDAFLVKFNPSGVRQWATYYGGSGAEEWEPSCVTGLVGDSGWDVFLAGTTESPSGIAVGGHQTTIGGLSDGFLVRFNPNGVRVWSTYYGGTGIDKGLSCALDGLGFVYLSGETSSTSNISAGGYQSNYGGGTSDAFLVRLSVAGVRNWATYLGGSNKDWGGYCAVGDNNRVYVAGHTASTSGISSSGFQNVYGGGISDAFLIRLSHLGVLQWGTYYGGPNEDYGYSCARHVGHVYLAGWTKSTSGIAAGGHQNTMGSALDAYLAKLVGTTKTPSFGLNESDDIKNFASVYPNPTSGTLSVYFDRVNVEQVQIDVFDSHGKLLDSQVKFDTDLKTVDISYPPGVYLILLTRNAERSAFKVLKE